MRKKPTVQHARIVTESVSVPLFWLLPVLIVGATATAFFPALQNGFVDWDDYKTLVENKSYRGLGWEQLRWMFTTLHMGHYQPLSWVTFGMDYLVWGMDPVGYHLTNVILHAANAVLFYFVAFRLLAAGRINQTVADQNSLAIAAGIAALFFAVHPLRVESVAWATERRDVLSGLFFLLIIYFYLRGNTAPASNPLPPPPRGGSSGSYRWMIGTLIFYILALLTKAITITTPLVLLILDAYPLGRLSYKPTTWLQPQYRKVWLEKLPFLVLSLVFGLNALFAQKGAGLRSVEEYDFLSRVAQTVYGIAFYLWKTIIPLGLSPLYELPPKFNAWDWPFLVSGLAVLSLCVALYFARNAWPAAIAAGLYYLVVIGPMLGIVQSGPQIAADRYSYLCCLSWAVLVGGSLRYFWNKPGIGTSRQKRLIFCSVAAGVVMLGLSVLTWKQTLVWRDSETLWKHALAVGQQSSTVHYNLAYVLHRKGQLGDAIEHYRKSLSFNPIAPDAHYYLADALTEAGEAVEATKHYREAIRIRPHFWGAHYNLAILFERRGNTVEALQHYRNAVQINPHNAAILGSLAAVLSREGRMDEAIEHFQRSLKLDPSQSNIYFAFGTALAMHGLLDHAANNFRQAIQLDSRFAPAHYNLGRVLAAQGQFAKSVDSLQKAVELAPESGEVHMTLSQVLTELGKKDEALRHYQEAVRISNSRRMPVPR